MKPDELHKWYINGRRKFIGFDLSKTNLNGANLCKIDLRAADLSEANLRAADLSGANLKETDFNKANLSRANLSKADLRGADLSEANLRAANLSEALLCEVDLKRADLRRANLNKAKLHEIDLREANLNGVDLNKAILFGGIVLSDNLKCKCNRINLRKFKFYFKAWQQRRKIQSCKAWRQPLANIDLLANEMNIKPSHLLTIINGSHQIDEKTLLKLCQIFKCLPGEITLRRS